MEHPSAPAFVALIGVPVQEGSGRRGCDMGPSAYRAAELAETLRALGHIVEERGMVAPGAAPVLTHTGPVARDLPAIAAWTATLTEVAAGVADSAMPIFMGGDHSLSAGTVAGMAMRAARTGRPLFVLWLDAHPDFHTLDTSTSGHLHGVPLAYVTGQKGFEGAFPPLAVAVDPAHVCMMGIRSVDPAERKALARAGITVHDMRAIDENGVVALLRPFLQQVQAAGGVLHVSLDVDFLDPGIAPGVGTTVPGGATLREAHLIMEMLHDSGLVTSLDVVELNPFLDERGRTALLMVDLIGSLMGKRVLERGRG